MLPAWLGHRMQFDRQKRREFITLLGCSAVGWPLEARAQQPRRPTIGFVGANASVWTPWTASFVRRLGELGWIEGRTVAIEYRWSEGLSERIAEIAAEFVRLKVDVILTNWTSVSALKQATPTIPIVFVLAIDAAGSDLIASLARPGGNVTGLSAQSAEIAGKRLGLLREIVPQLRRLAIMAHVDSHGAVVEMEQIQAAARALGVDIATLEIHRAEDIASAFAALKAQADALFVVNTALMTANITRVNTFALTARLPTIFANRIFVQAGGLMSYGANYSDQLRRAAEYVDKILRGAKPGDIPVEQPTKFDLVINLITAQALGLSVPPTLLALADEVIE
jgi:putative tryptophan/tyrosine transport system substrate-binding protein